jgi:AraC family transcriptional regulator
MTASADIVRFSNADASIAHCIFPAWEAGEYISVSNPASVAVAFTGQRQSTVELHDGRRGERTIPAASYGTAGAEPISWIRVKEPSECLEVTASPALRAAVAGELSVSQHRELADLHGSGDPIVWSIAARLRAMLRAGAATDAMEIEALVRRTYARVLTLRFGGKPAARGDGGLGRARLSLLFDWIEAHLGEEIAIARLAAVAALSHAHFIRSFKRSVGVSPHHYVRSRRLERAREQLATGASVAVAAHSTGFLSASQFRKAFFIHFGHAPHLTPRRGAQAWIHPEDS